MFAPGKIINASQKLINKMYKKVSGTSVTLTNAAKSKLHGLTVYGKAVQDGTPAPSTPVDIQVVEGRNLVDFANPASVNTDGGVTFTINADGSYDAHGTATKNTYIYVTNNSSGFQLPAGSYTFSARNQDGSYPPVLRVGASRWVDGKNTNYGSASGKAFTFNHNGQGNIQLLIYVNNGGTVDATVYPQLEAGSTATPYAAYDSIGLKVGSTTILIDLQGNVLASLPDGTKDMLIVDSEGHCEIAKNVSYIASYNGESVGSVYLSNTGQLTTGAEVYYKASSTSIIDLGYIDMPQIKDNSNISIIATVSPNIEVEYKKNLIYVSAYN